MTFIHFKVCLETRSPGKASNDMEKRSQAKYSDKNGLIGGSIFPLTFTPVAANMNLMISTRPRKSKALNAYLDMMISFCKFSCDLLKEGKNIHLYLVSTDVV